MAGRLTDKFMDQLEQWIGTGPKKFDLLYAITRDGCSATAFHQKCDNQGPTVTVLYNKQGSVYGGYTAVSWSTHNKWNQDNSAFLFRLQHNHKGIGNKFPSNCGPYDVFHHVTYGPLFGSGRQHDLLTFMNTINCSGTDYPLNGQLYLGNSYDSQGISNDDVNNGTMNVTELEVYRVTDGQRLKPIPPKPKVLDGPWRKTPVWSAKSLEDLQSEVENFSPPREVKVSQANVLVIGPVGAGKSSFFNTVASIFRGRVTRQASSGSAENSITSQYRMYKVRSSLSGQPLNFRLCDTRGIEENQTTDASDVNYMLEGNVPEGYQFNPSVPISSEILGFKRNPTLNDRIHCVCIVIDGSTAGVLPEKILGKLKAIQSKVYLKGVPQIVLLTKIDKVCSQVEGDVSKVFLSEAILEQVNKVSQLLGVPRNNVFPIKNYETEIELEENINILALIALTQILRASEDYLYNYLDDVCRDSDNAPTLNSKD